MALDPRAKAAVERAGEQLGEVGGQVVDLDTHEHQRLLIGSPRDLAVLTVELWVAEPQNV